MRVCRSCGGLGSACKLADLLAFRKSVPTPWYFRFCLVGLLLQTCASSCGEVPEPVTPPFSGANVPHLKASEGELTVRIRVSKPELTVDCGSNSFPIAADDRVFLPWRSLTLRSDPTPVFRLEERGKEADQKCTLIAFDLREGPLVVRTGAGFQDFTVVKDSSGKLSVLGATELPRPTEKATLCAAQKPLSWSDATLTGNAQVKAVEATPDGCQVLKLSPSDAAEGAVFSWSACVGAAKLPFAAGDAVRITNNENPATHARALRIERTRGDRVVMWLLRGPPGSLPTVGWDPALATISSTMRGEDCRAELRPNCSTVEVGQDVTFNVSPRSLALRAGESANLTHTNGTKLELYVVHSLLRPVVDPGCSREIDALPGDLGIVVIERGGPTDKTPEIAR